MNEAERNEQLKNEQFIQWMGNHPKTYYAIIFIAFIIGILWLELCTAVLSGFDLEAYRIFPIVLGNVGLALLLGTICKIHHKIRFLPILILEILTIFFLIEFFSNASYYTFMSPEAIFQGAKGVVTEFGSAVKDVIIHGMPVILLMHLPVITLAIYKGLLNPLEKDQKSHNWKKMWPVFMTTLLASVFLFSMASEAYSKYNDTTFTYGYTFDGASRKYGLLTASYLDSKYQLYGVPVAPVMEEEIVVPSETDGYNMTETDFLALSQIAEDDELAEMLRYVHYQTASSQNEYTGLFEGKNLIFITAESFSKELLDENLTPTLYRMASKGIVVENYYQPFWGGSTTTGEASLLLGLIPCDGVPSIQETIGKDNRYTIANMLSSLNYFTAAYHAGDYDYYDRYLTHPGLGYSYYLARGNGLEDHVAKTWPGDDMTIEEYTADLYMDQSPFHIYWMTFAGHGLYNFHGNQMSIKHQEELDGLEFESETLKAYYACSLDFEHAVENMLVDLEEHGQLENTVIVISSDHYPYALQKGDAWKNEVDHLSMLYGYYYSNQAERDHNQLIIWTPSLEENDPIVVDSPCYSVDVLPTLLNLFGLKYDSRLYVGRDILSDSEAFVVWADGSWLNEAGYYNAANGKFTQKDPSVVISSDYIETLSRQASNKIRFSRYLLRNDFYKSLEELESTTK